MAFPELNQPKASPELLAVSPLQRAKRTAEMLFDNEERAVMGMDPQENPWGKSWENLGNILGSW